ncbi:MAG: phosphatidate cytidylyltransferase [Alphaproteobacteria bacterium]|nr:phosphatidate cytidylyltransferase [Alphaproteobacteria bacterium]
MARFDGNSLKIRVLSALLLAPAVLAVMYRGGWLFDALLAIAGVLALHEWYKMAVRSEKPILFGGIGAVYILFAFAGFYLLERDVPVEGAPAPFVLTLVIWASDIGAYFFGKTIGGPKLAPKISPGKTWAGLSGAFVTPFLGLLIVHLLSGHMIGAALVFGAVGGVVGMLGQAGDLMISFFKRKVNVKDTGDLIPGHGGILDRIDSFLLVSFLMFFVLALG